MIQIIRNEMQSGVKRYVCDTSSELASIDTRTAVMGSSCYVIDDGDVYFLDSKRQWKKKGNSGSSSSGDDTEEVIYDGGEVK